VRPLVPKIVYSVAASADGFIARADGGVDWLDARDAADYGMAEFLDGVSTIVWGRRTFDQAQTLGGLAPFGERRHVVVTHRPPTATDPRVSFTSEPVATVARRLRAAAAKDVWVMGGAEVAGALVDAGAVDEIVVHVIPVLLGDGVPLLSHAARNVDLSLLEAKAFPDGVVRLRYALRAAERPVMPPTKEN